MLDVAEQLRRYGEAAEAATTPTLVDAPQVPSRRMFILGGAIAAVVLLVLGVLAAVSVTDETVVSGGPDAREGTGEWSEVPAAPVSGRIAAGVVVTDDSMLVWGGWNGTALADGAALSFQDRSWRALPQSPLSPRARPLVVWTGDEMIVWGGSAGITNDAEVFDDGAAYNPSTNVWRVLPSAGIGGAQQRAAVVWTGAEVVLIGGSRSPGAGGSSDTWALDPRSGRWRELPVSPGLANVRGIAALWTGERLLAVAIADGAPVTIHSLDPRGPSWNSVVTGVPGLDTGVDGVAWTGRQLVIVGHYRDGVVYDPVSESMVELEPSRSQARFQATSLKGIVSVGDRWLDVESMTWHSAGTVPGRAREWPLVVTDGEHVVIWGGDGCGPTAQCTGYVDPGAGLLWDPPDT